MARREPNVAERSAARRKPARGAPPAPAAPSWSERLHAVLRDLAIRQVAYVPDSGHAPTREGTALKHRFREALLGPEEAYR